MLKTYIAFAILSAVCAYRTQGIFVDEYPEPYNEELCLSEGGVCVVAEECPDGKLAEKSGLCPAQQLQGVECCYGISKYNKMCTSNGGKCMPSNYRCGITYEEAIDCGSDENCCILVK